MGRYSIVSKATEIVACSIRHIVTIGSQNHFDFWEIQRFGSLAFVR